MTKKPDLNGPHQGLPVHKAGQPLEQAKAAMILLHGRGATPPDILSLASEIYHPDFAYLAPQAANNTWYPFSFLAPIEDNEPGLSSGLRAISDVLSQVEEAGLSPEKVIIGGFSQGACLAAEYTARNARHYGGLLVFSGGLIGPLGTARDYPGSLAGTPVFLGCSNTDFHIPEERVHESAQVFERMGAAVTKRIYPNMGHTIIEDELVEARKIVQMVAPG